VRYAAIAPLWLGYISLFNGVELWPWVAAVGAVGGLAADHEERTLAVADLGLLAVVDLSAELVEELRGPFDRLDLGLAAAVLATHGVLDTLVTAWGVHATKRTSVEANPLLDPSVQAAYQASIQSGLWPAVRAVAVPKVPAVAAAVVLLLLARWVVPRRAWRAGAGLFAGSGLLVVASNLWELSTSNGVTLL
jgi:hypothetical protein